MNRSETASKCEFTRSRVPYITICLSCVLIGCSGGVSNDELLRQAADSLGNGDTESAARLSRRVLESEPSAPARLLLAQSLQLQNDTTSAVAELQAISDSDTSGADARYLEAQFQFQRGFVQAAEAAYRKAVDIQPRDDGILQLATILSRQGRTWECRSFLLHQLKRGNHPVDHLFWCARPDALHGEPSRAILEQWSTAETATSGTSLGLARLDDRAGWQNAAIARLQKCVAKHPENGAVQGYLGQLLFEHRSRKEFLAWYAALPETLDDHPDLWIAKGVFAESCRHYAAAADFFRMAARLDPDSRTAVYRAGRLIKELEGDDVARPLIERARLLEQLDKIVGDLEDDRSNVELSLSVAKLCDRLGRWWEARGWYQYVHYLRPNNATQEHITRLESGLTATTPATLLSEELSESLKLPTIIPQIDSEWVTTTEHGTSNEAQIRFEDVTDESGIEFHYFSGLDASKTHVGMQGLTGGGVGVIDFDIDGLPDVLLTQGATLPFEKTPNQPNDQLYRNKSNQKFDDVTAQAAINDVGFGQGVATGDFDNDGFPDLYIANLGRDQLLKNNGDGTFTDLSRALLPVSDTWSTSCGFADLNADGLSDLYVVGYLGGEGVISKLCHDENGIPRMCRPSLFSGVCDQVLINSGAETFTDQSAELGFRATQKGRGLGVVIFRRPNERLPCVFVANDGEPNFFFTARNEVGLDVPQFYESALSFGLALDGNGRSEACMGVACSDINDDGVPDLLVTNFYQESNTLYLSSPELGFRDGTIEARLQQPSLPVLGFGTQFLDADLDGDQDLVVTNGHEGDHRDLGIPYYMSPQVFANIGSEFEEVDKHAHGGFLQGEYLGRGLARIDFNSDGRSDFLVSHLNSPARLLKNVTDETGNFLSVRLIGTQSSRVPTGVIVRLTAGGRVFQKQLISGDGYQACNEQLLCFGIGTNDRIDAMSVSWPSGEVEEFTDVVVGGHYTVVERFGCWLTD